MEKRDDLYIRHILEAIDQVAKYVSMLTFDAFAQDRKTQDATIRQIEIIGEAAKRLSPGYMQKVDLPWKEITGTRDFLIHHYADVDTESLWKTVKVDLVVLEQRLKETLE